MKLRKLEYCKFLCSVFITFLLDRQYKKKQEISSHAIWRNFKFGKKIIFAKVQFLLLPFVKKSPYLSVNPQKDRMFPKYSCSSWLTIYIYIYIYNKIFLCAGKIGISDDTDILLKTQKKGKNVSMFFL